MINVNRLRKAMRHIASKKGDLTLFALFRRTDGLGAWDLIVSAPWLEESKYKAVSEIVDLLVESIGRKSLVDFARVEPIPANNPTIKFIVKNYPVDDGELRIPPTGLFDLPIEEVIILRAKRPVTKKPARRALQRAS